MKSNSKGKEKLGIIHTDLCVTHTQGKQLEEASANTDAIACNYHTDIFKLSIKAREVLYALPS